MSNVYGRFSCTMKNIQHFVWRTTTKKNAKMLVYIFVTLLWVQEHLFFEENLSCNLSSSFPHQEFSQEKSSTTEKKKNRKKVCTLFMWVPVTAADLTLCGMLFPSPDTSPFEERWFMMEMITVELVPTCIAAALEVTSDLSHDRIVWHPFGGKDALEARVSSTHDQTSDRRLVFCLCVCFIYFLATWQHSIRHFLPERFRVFVNVWFLR